MTDHDKQMKKAQNALARDGFVMVAFYGTFEDYSDWESEAIRFTDTEEIVKYYRDVLDGHMTAGWYVA